MQSCGNHRMLSRNHNRVRTINSVNPSRKDTDFRVRILDGEINQSTHASSNPIALHRQNAFGPATFELTHVVQQLVGVLCDSYEPLSDLFLFNGRSAAPAYATGRLFIGQHRLFLWTPINGRQLFIDQSLFIHLQEKPLIPFVVVGTVSEDFASPVVTDSQPFQLSPHVSDIFFSPIPGIYTAFYGSLFGRLAEAVPTNRVQHVKPSQSLIPGQRVANGVVSYVAHVQKAGWVWQHFKAIK